MKRYALLTAASASAILLAYAAAAQGPPETSRRGGGDNTNPAGARLVVVALEGWSGKADLSNGAGGLARISAPFYSGVEGTNSAGARVFLGLIGPDEEPDIVEANSSGVKVR
jgi:hypothetical protein